MILDKSIYLYYGNLFPTEPQFKIPNFVGLALHPRFEKDIKHSAYETLPWPDGSVAKVQSQDVFEHLEVDRIPAILDDIFRVLQAGGVFRLSVPDYNCPFIRNRCIFDSRGNVAGDLMMGASAAYDRHSLGIKVSFVTNGDAHLWFPTYDKVVDAVLKSNIRKSSKITFYQFYRNKNDYVCNSVPELEMSVQRAPPRDDRNGAKPISIVVDFVK